MNTLLKFLIVIIGAPIAARTLLRWAFWWLHAIAFAQITYHATHDLQTAFGVFFTVLVIVPMFL